MVEKMARAMAEARTGSPEQWIHFKAGTLAALKVMREPTDEMTSAYTEGCSGFDGPAACYIDMDGWRAMIDAAIAEHAATAIGNRRA